MIKKLEKVFVNLVAIDSPSGEEERIGNYIQELFGKIGISLEKDEAGNLFGYVPGVGEPLLLSAHMDTVSPGKGKVAIVKSDGIVESDKTTVLGADDLTAITEIYVLCERLSRDNRKHRPIEILISTGEELYVQGAKRFDYTKIKSKQAYVLDLSGELGGIAYAAPTILSFQAKILGRASHAGFEPEAGIHSISIAANAIQGMKQGFVKDGLSGNVGLIQGGTGTNIVPASTVVSGEIRSAKHEDAIALADEYRRIFEEEAQAKGATVEWEMVINAMAYEWPLEDEVITNYIKALEKNQIESRLVKTFGGSDNNVFATKGIRGVVVSNSMYNIHTVDEYCNLYEMEKIVYVLEELISLE